MIIDKSNPIPLYYQVKDILFEAIETGTYKPGDRLPSERSLADQFGVTRVTLRKAIKVLEEEGYLEVRHRAGIFVKDRKHLYLGNHFQNKSKIIGVLVPAIQRGILVDLLRGIEDEAIKDGYSTIVCNSDNQGEKAKMYAHKLIENGVSGVVFLPIQDIVDSRKKEGENQTVIHTLYQKDIPVVLVDRPCKSYDTDLVISDNFGGGNEVTNYLIKNGHTRIGVVYDFEETSVRDRIDGYKKAMQNHNIPINENLVQKLKHDEKASDRAILKSLIFDYKVTAIFALNDLIAVDVMNLYAHLNVKIPDSVSLIGYDNLPFTEHLSVPLTTVNQPIYQMGVQSCRLLKERMETEAKYLKKVILGNDLIIRKSVKAWI